MPPITMARTLALATVLIPLVTAARADEPSRVPEAFAARLIVAVADGDFNVGSYQHGTLPDAADGHRDRLVILRREADGWRMASLAGISNSVAAPPEVLALSPDGRFDYVAEMLGERLPGATRVSDLPPGRHVTAIDLSNPADPRVVGRVALDAAPESLRLSPDGRMLALSLQGGAEERIALVPVEAGVFGTPQTIALAEFGVRVAEGAPRASVDATAVEWHPNGQILAVNLNRQDSVLFLRLARGEDGTITGASALGAPVGVGRDPFVGRFLPDGRHYLTADWGRNFAAADLGGRLPATPSTLTLVMVHPDGLHRVAGTISGDTSSEGLAVSPDGRWVATLNMRGTALPADHPRYAPEASVLLFRMEPATGRLQRVADRRFRGILPEGIAFDAASRHLVGTVFQHEDRAGGALAFWRIAEGEAGRVTLEEAGQVAMPHGVHHVEIAR